MEGVQRYRGIFDKNTQDDVQQFFEDPLIVKLWPGILNHFNEDVYNKGDHDQNKMMSHEEEKKKCDLRETNCKITKQFKEIFKLELP